MFYLSLYSSIPMLLFINYACNCFFSITLFMNMYCNLYVDCVYSGIKFLTDALQKYSAIADSRMLLPSDLNDSCPFLVVDNHLEKNCIIIFYPNYLHFFFSFYNFLCCVYFYMSSLLPRWFCNMCVSITDACPSRKQITLKYLKNM